MKKDNTIDVQNQIIQRQKKMISDLEEKLESTKANIELEKYFSEPAYATVEELINDLEQKKLIFDDAIAKAREAEFKYNELIKETQPLVLKYKQDLKKMNTTLQRFIPRK